jgi:hypothetical protein
MHPIKMHIADSHQISLIATSINPVLFVNNKDLSCEFSSADLKVVLLFYSLI